MNRWYFDLSEESRLHLEKLYKSKNVSEPSIWKDSEEKSNESWKKELEQCSDLDLATSTLHLLTFFFCHTCPLQFVFCISYSVFCILYFLFCIFASPQVVFLHHWISQSEGKGRASLLCCIYCSYCFSTSHILSPIACFCWMMLQCILWQRRLLQF